MADKRIVVSFEEQTISPSVFFKDYIGSSDKYFVFTQGIPSST